jgi:hypothetical protein
MELKLPVYQATRFMVLDENKEALRGFHTKSQAQTFINNDKELSIKELPQKYKTYQVEEAPF